jgi:MYXO-CTERM domain-containing protein
MFAKRLARLALPATALLGLFSSGSASADVFLQVNTTTGDLRIYGDADDVLSRYEIKTASTAEKSFNYTLYAVDTDASADVNTATRWGTFSVAAGFGLWHTHGTTTGVDTGLGYKVTNQIGEMSAVFAGGTGVNTSKLLTFSSLASDSLGYYLDLGNVFIPGSAQDLIFSYVDTMGYSYALSSGPKTYTISVAGSPYDGLTYTNVTPITSDLTAYPLSVGGTYVSYVSTPVPEPAPLALAGLGALVLVMRRRMGVQA